MMPEMIISGAVEHLAVFLLLVCMMLRGDGGQGLEDRTIPAAEYKHIVDD